ncbi:Tryptophan--tRNA ligase [compost metagenome]
MYGPFKKDLAEVVVAKLAPIQERYRQIRESGEITNILRQGAERAEEMAATTLAEVQKRMGFLPK